jgi:hypothetical protein
MAAYNAANRSHARFISLLAGVLGNAVANNLPIRRRGRHSLTAQRLCGLVDTRGTSIQVA